MYRSIWFVVLVFALALSISACQPVMPESVVVAQEDEQAEALEAVRTVSGSFAEVYAQGDAAAVAALYTEDGMIMAPNLEVITGHENIAAFWQSAMDGGVTQLEIVAEELEVKEDTAIERGNAQLFLTDGTSVDTIKYLLIWKEIDGEWLLHRDMWNSNLPLPAQ